MLAILCWQCSDGRIFSEEMRLKKTYKPEPAVLNFLRRTKSLVSKKGVPVDDVMKTEHVFTSDIKTEKADQLGIMHFPLLSYFLECVRH